MIQFVSMKNSLLSKIWLLLLTISTLQACSSSFQKNYDELHSITNDRTERAQILSRQTTTSAPLVADEKFVRFTTRSIPLVQSAMLPPNIETVTVRYPGRHNLNTIADILTRTLGVVVIMTPDALMDPRSFAPGLSSAAALTKTGATGTQSPNTTDSLRSGLISQALQSGATRLNLSQDEPNTSFELNYSGPLSSLLDWIANQAQLRWSFENDRIIFRRVITQFIQVKTLPGALKGTSSFSSSISSSTASLSSEIGGDFWAALSETLPLMVSTSGQFKLDTKLGLITVRDAIQNVQEVERYVEHINQLFLRQVNIQVEIIQIDMSTDTQSGIDWENIARNLSNGAVLRTSGPSFNAAGASAGSIGIFKGNNQLLFKNLERYGRVSTMYSAVLNTMHRQAVPLNVSNSRTYLRSITAGTINTNGSNTGPTLTAADLNTGFMINLMPVILDSNRVLLESSIGISSTRELQQYSTGTGLNQALVQQPNVDMFQNVQRVSMALGETLVLLGYQYEEARNNSSDVVREFLPASKLGVSSKKSVIILLTPSLSRS